MNTEFGLLPKIGLTANPSKNFLYRLFYKPWKSGTLPEQYAFIRSLYGDNPHTIGMVIRCAA
jgi:phage terminase large subunit